MPPCTGPKRRGKIGWWFIKKVKVKAEVEGKAGKKKVQVKVKVDGFAKSRQKPLLVIPAKAGIQEIQQVQKPWTPVFTGVTTFCDSIKVEVKKNLKGISS